MKKFQIVALLKSCWMCCWRCASRHVLWSLMKCFSFAVHTVMCGHDYNLAVCRKKRSPNRVRSDSLPEPKNQASGCSGKIQTHIRRQNGAADSKPQMQRRTRKVRVLQQIFKKMNRLNLRIHFVFIFFLLILYHRLLFPFTVICYSVMTLLGWPRPSLFEDFRFLTEDL